MTNHKATCEVMPTARPLAEVLSDLSVALEPQKLEDLTDGVKYLSDCGAPGVRYECRAGSKQVPLGKVSIDMDSSAFTFSDLLEVEWATVLEDGRSVVVRANADITGNRHPPLLILEFPASGQKNGGRVCSLKEEGVPGWLGQFLNGLTQVDAAVTSFINRPRTPAEPSRTFEFIDGKWQEVDG